MAMNKTTLKNLIKTKIEAATGGTLPAASLLAFEALADAIITHITTSATIAVTVTSVSGVTTGAGVSGPGTGTATIT